MKIQDVIDQLLITGEKWINRNCTRDVVLFGDANQTVNKIVVCWVATNEVIHESITQNANFIISHENCFYEEGTALPQEIRTAREEKRKLLQKHNICVYRCHDVWDNMPVYGVADVWADSIGIPFEPRTNEKAVLHFSQSLDMTALQLAEKMKSRYKSYGQTGIELFGDPKQKISRIAIGVGAINNLFEMVRMGADCVILSDDGLRNWIELQYLVDLKIPAILVHHAICEEPGLAKLADYLQAQYPQIPCVYQNSGYRFTLLGE